MINLTIIVPVYNVEEYLVNCLSSISCQTRTDFCVILVDDGSYDLSGKICREWCERDSRFIYYYQKNQGLGPARNVGIQMSRTEWLTFVDSDDYIANDYVEKMLAVAENSAHDIVYCDFYAFYENGKYEYNATRSFDQFYNLTNNERIQNPTNCAIWAAVYRRELWIKNGITMPPIIYEDTAVFFELLSKTRSIGAVFEGLYFYRKGRDNSLMEIGRNNYSNMVKSLECARKNHGYKTDIVFERYVVRKLHAEWAYFRHKKGIDISEELGYVYSSFFPEGFQKNVKNMMTIGGYITTQVFNNLSLKNNSSSNYEYSSIISMMSQGGGECAYTLSGDNLYRMEMVDKDITKRWREKLDQKSIVVFDLLCERFDIIECNGTYYTKSDAYDAFCTIFDRHRVIKRESSECFDVWKDSVDRFICLLFKRGIRIFMLEIYLCSKFGYPGYLQEYEQKNYIEGVNSRLSDYYLYIKKTYPYVEIISTDSDDMITDGCLSFEIKPWFHGVTYAGKLASMLCERVQLMET